MLTTGHPVGGKCICRSGKMFDRGYKMKVQWSLQRNSLTLELQRFDDIPAISIIGRGG